MENNQMLCPGARVKMISNYLLDEDYKVFYPPVGTLGTIEYVCNDSTVTVFWDSDVKFVGEESWYCWIYDVEVVE